MTDSELIKALENSINTYNEKGVYVDKENLQQQVLDLIKRQKKELEAIKDKKVLVFKLSEEQINEIKEQINETKGGLLKSVEYNERKIKAEAYKEFAEKAKENFQNLEYSADTYRKTVKVKEMKEQINWVLHSVAAETLDNILEELVGENNERNIV